MAFGNLRSSRPGPQRPVREINMIPLIDVMLVLLIVFMVTAPLLTHAVRIRLPQASSQPNPLTPGTIQLAIRETGELFWNGKPVSLDDLQRMLAVQASLNPQPELHIHADAATPYHVVAKTLALAANAGLTGIGFVSAPENAARSRDGGAKPPRA